MTSRYNLTTLKICEGKLEKKLPVRMLEKRVTGPGTLSSAEAPFSKHQ